ncbi:MAG: hypothetical protein KF681_06895 [Bdellovibrionaceae bacterium]|nr:hypothetical protein [Pseudobdellovibrionaceae bacterium]
MHEERWLVKSSGRVLGPFTLEELIQHLRARTLSIIDEVRDPSTRWNFIREHPLLRDLVRQLREEQDTAHDSTQTTFVGSSGGRTVTLSVTEGLAQEGELTPNPSALHNIPRGGKDVRPISGTERNLSSTFGGGKAYGSLSDARVQSNLQKRGNLSRNILFGVAIALIAGSAFYFYNQKKNRVVANDQARSFVKLAREQVRYGQTEKALDYMVRARGAMAFSAEDRLLFSELLLQVEGKTVEAQRALTEVQNLQDPRLLREMSLAKILIHLKEQRWNDASVEINHLLSFNPNDEEALHNMALLQYYQGLYTTSAQTVSRLVERGYRSTELILLKGLLALSWPEKAGQVQRLSQAADEIKKDLDGNFELHFEKSLLYVTLKIQAGKADEVRHWLKSMWIADPFDSRNFSQNLLVDHQIIRWDRLAPLCNRIGQAIPDAEGTKGVQSLCLFFQGETASALQRLDEARKQLSQSGLLAAIQSLMYMQVNRQAEAKALLQLSQGEVLGLLAQGQMCQADTDWPCAEQAWEKVLQVVPDNPMALYGKAFVMKQRGNDNGAREQIRRSILSSPRYRPFLEARGETSGGL